MPNSEIRAGNGQWSAARAKFEENVRGEEGSNGIFRFLNFEFKEISTKSAQCRAALLIKYGPLKRFPIKAARSDRFPIADFHRQG